MKSIFLKKKTWPILILIISVPVIAVFSWLLIISTPSQEIPHAQPGVHVCGHCGMMVSDLRFAAAAKSSEDPTGDVMFFDDLGCFFSSVEESGEHHWRGWVYDYDTKEPISIKNAYFEKTKMQTPMGSGWIAHLQSSHSENEYLSLEGAIENK